jgi:hypothetical protein
MFGAAGPGYVEQMPYDDEQTPHEGGGADERAPSDPPQDPKQHPAPPSNPPVEQEDVDRGRDKIERISGN